MLVYSPPKVATFIPVIDLRDSFDGDDAARQRVADEIHQACRETGFFYVSHHGVPAPLISAQFAAAKQFFDMPLEAKLALHMKKSITAAGYDPVGGQTLDSQTDATDKAPPDLKESFYCGLEIAPDDPHVAQPVRCFGHNQWPNLPGFRTQMMAYYDAVAALGDHLLALLARSLDMQDDWFARFHAPAAATLRLIKYAPQDQNAAFNQIGAGAHTDWGGITILAQDDVGGLEVQTVGGDWITATPIPGTFIINLGDLMARWTNGVYSSNMHRVRNNDSGRDRYSVPFFYGPYPTSVIAPIPSCVGAGQPQKYATCTADDHMKEMFRRSYGYAPLTA